MEKWFEFIDWTFVVQIATIVLALIGGVKSVPIINKLKTWLNWSGRKAQFLVAVFSVVLAGAAQIVSGAIAPEPLSSKYIIELFTLILLSSQSEYLRLKLLIIP